MFGNGESKSGYQLFVKGLAARDTAVSRPSRRPHGFHYRAPVVQGAARDRIITIERGRIVEDGSHDQLIRSNGRYARLHYLQAGIQ